MGQQSSTKEPVFVISLADTNPIATGRLDLPLKVSGNGNSAKIDGKYLKIKIKITEDRVVASFHLKDTYSRIPSDFEVNINKAGIATAAVTLNYNSRDKQISEGYAPLMAKDGIKELFSGFHGNAKARVAALHGLLSSIIAPDSSLNPRVVNMQPLCDLLSFSAKRLEHYVLNGPLLRTE